jgi:hypothetical protein
VSLWPGKQGNSFRGLGLHIVETIVKGNGGSVSGNNRRNTQGAEFTIIVPLKKQTAKSMIRMGSHLGTSHPGDQLNDGSNFAGEG